MGTWKDSARLATADDIPDLMAVTVVDGVPVGLGDRILVKNQANPVDNGIYFAVANAPGQFRLKRAEDMRAGLATSDTNQATVRVAGGNQNAGTQWCLRAPAGITVGTTSLYWMQENRNYSVESIASLKKLVAAPIGSMASVAGYATAGDSGGGDFRFIGVEGRSRVKRATLISVVITWATPSSTGVTFTAPGHGFHVGQSVYLSDAGSATGARIIAEVDSQQFSLKGITSAVLDAKPRASCVNLEMEDAHGRPPGAQRVAVSGIVGSSPDPSPPNLNRIWDGGAVFDVTTLTLPVPLPAPVPNGWGYTCGAKAVVGDDALLVTATDAQGDRGGLWKRTISTPFHVAWWGALGDADERIDDSPAINAAINAAKRFRDYDTSRRRMSGSTVHLGPGVYRCASKILIDGPVSLEGASPGFGGAAMLVFDLNIGDDDALVDIVNAAIDGSGTSGGGARICNVQVAQDPVNFPSSANQRVRTVGIRVGAAAVTLEDIFVHHIQGHGIYIHGETPGPNANLWCLKGNVTVENCLGSGVLTEGSDANAGTQTGILSLLACDEWGVHEHSFLGNSWGAIHTAGNGFKVDYQQDGTTLVWKQNGTPVSPDWVWSSNKTISLGQRMLPTFSEDPAKDHRTGFTYRATEVTGVGKTGNEEPRWPTKLGETLHERHLNADGDVDSDVTWTCWSYEGGALYHEGANNYSTYEYIYTEEEQPCRFDNNTASIKHAAEMHHASQVITANAGPHAVPFMVWTRRSEPWDEDHVRGHVYYPVIVGIGEHLGEAFGEPRRTVPDWAVATFKRADQYNIFFPGGPGLLDGRIAPDVPGHWAQDIGVLKDRWDGVYGRTTAGGHALPPSLRWRVEWDVELEGHRAPAHPFHSYTQVGGRSLPQPAAMCFPSLWLGNKTGVECRLGAVPALGDGSHLPDLTDLDQSGGNAFEQGDILFNAPKEGRPNWPAAWRAKHRTAIATQAFPAGWLARVTFYAGYVLRADNGGLWRARNSGFSGTDRPPFESFQTPGTVLQDRDVSWELWSSDHDPTAWEPLITESPTLMDVDVSAGGTIALTNEQAAHSRIRFTGNPRSTVDVIVELGPNEFWTKTFVNATTGAYGLRVRAPHSEPGAWIHQGNAASLFTTGTHVESMSTPSRRGEALVSIDAAIGSATTWDEVPAVPTLFDLVDPEVRRVDVVVTVTNDTREIRGTWSITALAARVGATASLDGGGKDTNAIRTDDRLDARVLVAGTSVQLECTGLAGTHLTWGWEVRGQQQRSLGLAAGQV